MTKILSGIVIILMVLHLIRPLGLPGLKKRSDVWKIAVFVIAALMVTIVLRPGG